MFEEPAKAEPAKAEPAKAEEKKEEKKEEKSLAQVRRLDVSMYESDSDSEGEI